MRYPGSRDVRKDALDEVADALLSCPVCEGYLGNDENANWDLRLVRARSCVAHGYFFIRWWPTKKKITVEWLFDKYLPDL